MAGKLGAQPVRRLSSRISSLTSAACARRLTALRIFAIWRLQPIQITRSLNRSMDSLISQRYHRIDAGRPSCRHHAGKHARGCNDQRDAYEGQRVANRDTPDLAAALPNIGWHTFRHSYSTLLHALGAAPAVQKELLRHANIQTIMDIYTRAVTLAKREAASKVVDVLWRRM
jgi:integrase